MFTVSSRFAFSMLWHLGSLLTLAELPSEISHVLEMAKDSPVSVTFRRKPANRSPHPTFLTQLPHAGHLPCHSGRALALARVIHTGQS